MSNYMLAACFSVFLTTLLVARIALLVAGYYPEREADAIIAILFLLPLVIIVFALFLLVIEKLLKKLDGLLSAVSFKKLDFGPLAATINCIGYIQVGGGLLWSCVVAWKVITGIATQGTPPAMLFAALFFWSGVLLLKRMRLGVILSLLWPLICAAGVTFSASMSRSVADMMAVMVRFVEDAGIPFLLFAGFLVVRFGGRWGYRIARAYAKTPMKKEGAPVEETTPGEMDYADGRDRVPVSADAEEVAAPQAEETGSPQVATADITERSRRAKKAWVDKAAKAKADARRYGYPSRKWWQEKR